MHASQSAFITRYWEMILQERGGLTQYKFTLQGYTQMCVPDYTLGNTCMRRASQVMIHYYNTERVCVHTTTLTGCVLCPLGLRVGGSRRIGSFGALVGDAMPLVSYSSVIALAHLLALRSGS